MAGIVGNSADTGVYLGPGV